MINLIYINDNESFRLYDEITSIEVIDIESNLENKIIQSNFYDEEGNVNNIPYDIELKRITVKSNYLRSLNLEEEIYVLTGTTKNSTDSLNKDGVYLSGCICWVDNLGIGNEILFVSGSRSGSYSGDANYTVTAGTTPIGSGTFTNSFYDNSVAGENAMTFRLRINSYDSSGNKITLSIATSLID